MTDQHPSLPWNFTTHGSLDPFAFPDRFATLPRTIPCNQTTKAQRNKELDFQVTRQAPCQTSCTQMCSQSFEFQLCLNVCENDESEPIGTLVPSPSADCSQSLLQGSPYWPSRERPHNKLIPFRQGNQLVHEDLNCMVFFWHFSILMQWAAMPSILSMPGSFLKDVLACPYLRRGKQLRTHKRCPRKSPRTRNKLRRKYWKSTRCYAHACFRLEGVFADPFADTNATSAARTVCG